MKVKVDLELELELELEMLPKAGGYSKDSLNKEDQKVILSFRSFYLPFAFRTKKNP